MLLKSRHEKIIFVSYFLALCILVSTNIISLFTITINNEIYFQKIAFSRTKKKLTGTYSLIIISSIVSLNMQVDHKFDIVEDYKEYIENVEKSISIDMDAFRNNII